MAAQEDEFNSAVCLMLEKGKGKEFNQKLEETPSLLGAKSEFGMTLLHLAARNGDVESIKSLIKNAADPSYAGGPDGKQTALHYAAENSYFFAIYLTLLIKKLTKDDFTKLCIQVLKSAKIPNDTLPFLGKVLQLTLEKFEVILKQVLLHHL